MDNKAINYGKTVTSIFDALISAEINTEEVIGCFESPDALIFYSNSDPNADDRLYQLLSATLDDEQLAAFKDELAYAIEHYDDPESENDRLVDNFIIAADMQGMSPEQMAEDVMKIKEALRTGEDLKIPRMEDVWDLPETHDWSRG